MKKVIVLLFVLIATSVFSLTPSYAGAFEETLNVELNEVDAFANVVIFIRFNDEETYTAPYEYNHYENMFNGVDEVSLRDYYLEVSYDQLTIDSYLVNDNTQILYYDDINDRSYYEPYDSTTNPDGYDEESYAEQAQREHGLLKRAIDYVEVNNLIDDSIVLDSNDDGKIDSITFMVSGEDSGWSSLLWPHKWGLYTYFNYSNSTFTSDAPKINGRYALDYTFELLGNSASYDVQVSVGILAHETFHLISAPDLYHYYRYHHIQPVGDWGLMDGATEIPSHMLGYMKQYYGSWIDEVTEITESGTYTLAPLQDSQDNLYKIDLGYSNEFIYIEYRDNEGLYESNLPDSGLIVYRVDFDAYDLGNVYGYYNESLIPSEEVFIFRPGITDTTEPITFEFDDNESIDEDGNIDNAALSNNNTYDAMGVGTNILMFHNDGTLIDINISNVVEHNGYITFDISLPPVIELDINEELAIGTQLFLVDNPLFEYNFSVKNVSESDSVYYTLDGTTPTTSDLVYDGGLIPFNADSNVINIAVYDGETLITSTTRSFNFVDSIQTFHSAYGNNKNISWYLDFKYDGTAYQLEFDSQSETEYEYDFVNITKDGFVRTYSGPAVGEINLYYTSDDLLIQFTSDDSVDEFYGIKVSIELTGDITSSLIGDEAVEVSLGDEYIDEGVLLTGLNEGYYSVEVIGNVDSSLVGEYILTYNILDIDGLIVDTHLRTVNVVDDIAPIGSLIGETEITLEYLEEYIDLGALFTDNSDEDLVIDIVGTVDTGVLGTHIISYTATDIYGNVSLTISRTVNVVDSIAPSLELNLGLDTVYQDDVWIDGEISISDNYSTDLGYILSGVVDTSIVGEYIIDYRVTDDSGNVSVIQRYVNVVEKDVDVEFTCDKGISTYLVGDEVVPPSCYVNGELMDVNIDLVSNNNIGTYKIVYSIEIDGVTYEKASYVFIYDNGSSEVAFYDFKRRDLV